MKNSENTFVLKLADGEDIISSLKKLAVKKEISYGLLVSADGAIKEFELIASTSKNFYRDSFDINSISGKISSEGKGNEGINVRVSISSTGFTQLSGQLVRGKASGVLEIGIRKVNLKNIIGA